MELGLIHWGGRLRRHRSGGALSLLILTGCFRGEGDSGLGTELGGAGAQHGDSTIGGPVGGGGGSGPLAPGDCLEKWQPGEIYHPEGYDAAEAHGLDAKLQVERCTNCHGAELVGCLGAVSCDNCHDGGHPSGWRENCTYCHGGLETMEGAPPTDLDRTTPEDQSSFTAHTTHATGDTHPVFDCVQCHVKPADVLSPGHMFDDTPGHAEVSLSQGLSASGSYDGPGTASCKNLYCHGSGLAEGDYAVSRGDTTCETCHGTKELDRLTYDHGRHVNSIRKFADITCASCHPNADASGNIVDPSTHVDGKIDVVIEGVTYEPSGKTCAGTCHTSYPHNGEAWEAEDPFGGIFGF
jgi:hypothetical protein